MHSIVINVCMGELWRRLFWAKEMENGSRYKYTLAFRARDCGRLTGEALEGSILTAILTATARELHGMSGCEHKFVGSKTLLFPCSTTLPAMT